MSRDVAPVEPPVDDGCRDTSGYAGESHCLAPGSLDGLLWRRHHLGRHWEWQSREREKRLINSREKRFGGLDQIESSGTRPAPPLQTPPHSLQPNSSLRSGQSDSSSQWKLAGMQRLVETHWKCVGPHTSPGCLTAGDKANRSEQKTLAAGQGSSSVTFSRCLLGHSLRLAHLTHNASKTEPNTMRYKGTSFWHSVMTTQSRRSSPQVRLWLAHQSRIPSSQRPT